MKQSLEVGDLVRDKLNEGAGSYGLGVVVGLRDPEDNIIVGQVPQGRTTNLFEKQRRYDVYFTKFEKVITFQGDYLEKV
jgi:hypothetical protein